MSGKKGLIVKGIAGFYYVKSGDEVYRCKARGVFKQRAVKPAVGDEVEFEVIPENDDSLITGVLPRRNSFIRPFIVNVDCFAIVTAAASPAPILSVIDKFMVMAEKKEIAVSVDCPEDLTVSHDSKWTSEALFNLLDNAVKYTPAGGKIAVSVVLWEMYVEIKVTDTGKGISESNQAAIFRRFYREEEVHEQQGVGIGLYLAREIVTRQGGYIKVVSEPGKGSEFSIMLPTK